MIKTAGAAIFISCMAGAPAWADCTSPVVPERLSCLNQELAALRADSARQIAGLKTEIQGLRNQVLALKQIVEELPPPASIVRLDDEVNVLWDPQDGCLAWTGPALDAPAPTGGGLMQVFAPCSKAPSRGSVVWRLQKAPPPR